jgi:catechol 2,3-dioxygenase-like lactoylglutathione lyase family enzyme
MTIRLKSLHHVAFAVSDVEETLRFCLDFGLTIAARTDAAVYLRGAGSDAYSFALCEGVETEMLRLALVVEEEADLHRAVNEFGASAIRALDGPGRGVAVTLRDPDGTPIDLVYGIAAADPQAMRDDLVLNTPMNRSRVSRRQVQPEWGPAPIIRLGHVGLFVTDFGRSANWYQRILGLLLSDGVVAGPNKASVAGFFRMDRGDELVDHHTIALFPGKKGGAQHLSFEVQDSEAQAIAHEHLVRQGWEPLWGMGRHALGSHVFDIWWAPNDIRFETFSDTDLHDATKPPELHEASPELTRWGGEMPMEYIYPKGTPGFVGGPPQ